MKKGKIIDTKWKVEEEKEGGGQGQVYKVSCEKLPGEVFALKFLKQQKCEERRKRMYREVCNISKLSDEHIMNIVDSNVESYEDDNIKLYYVSNYIEGEKIEKFVTENVVSFECALAFFKDFLQVISYCHENNIIHRDIKPDNILLHDNIL